MWYNTMKICDLQEMFRKYRYMHTEIFKVYDNADQAAERAGTVLKNGGIAAFPTDTVYGLGAVYSNAGAVRKIFEAKGRPENKPLSILISDISQVSLLAADIPEEAYRLMEHLWPGALTIIFRKNKAADIPDEVTAGADTIGLRMPDSDLALKIIRATGSPVAAPSANLSGLRSASCAQHVIADLNRRIDLIVDAGDCPIGISSTIIDMSGDEYRILRQGSIRREDICRYITL